MTRQAERAAPPATPAAVTELPRLHHWIGGWEDPGDGDRAGVVRGPAAGRATKEVPFASEGRDLGFPTS
jgi:hypothetical protein